MSDDRMPNPGRAYSATIGRLVTGIAIGAVILQHLANLASSARAGHQGQRQAAAERRRKPWIDRLEECDRGYIDGDDDA